MGKRYTHLMIAIATTLLCIVASPAIAHLTSSPSRTALNLHSGWTRPRLTTAQGLVEQGQNRYNAGQFQEAVQLLQQAVDHYAASNELLQQAIALGNLSLTQQALGDWDAATTAIHTSLDLLSALPNDTPDQRSVTAQVWTIQGRLQFAQGQFQQAFDTWDQVTQYYQQQGNTTGMIESRLNQTQALQAMGFYKQAIDQLTSIQATLTAEPDSAIKVAALENLGNALRIAGYLGRPTLNEAPFGDDFPAVDTMANSPVEQPANATTVLTQALTLAQALGLKNAIASISIHLGDIARSQAANPAFEYDRDDWLDKAVAFYQKAIDPSGSTTLQTDAYLRQFDISIDRLQWQETQRLRTPIQLQLRSVSPSRTTIYQQVQLAQGLIRFKQKVAQSPLPLDPAVQPIQWTEIATLLVSANQQAEALGDTRVQAYVLGTLGYVYELANRAEDALTLTNRALRLSLATNASDIAYQWYWQLARLRQQAGDREGAIAAYDQAIATIKRLRVDLAAVDQEAQFSFRASIEPIHRELVALLLDPIIPADTDLEKARQTIEDLQLAELDNFFRESCLNAKAVDIDALDRQAAVVYPIVLSDRLEIILSLPEANPPDATTRSIFDGGSMAAKSIRAATPRSALPSSERHLRHFTRRNLSPSDMERTVAQIRRLITQPGLAEPTQAELQQLLATVYDWLIQPFASELQTSNTKTLVFVLDDPFRSIPMGALFNGDRYLLEDYSIALTPGLQLTESTPPDVQNLDVLLGGLSESREKFPELPNVEIELAKIAATVTSSQELFNDQFTNTSVQRRVNATASPVVHLATHGQFGTQFDDTYLLTWDNRLNIRELSTLLQSSELNRRRPIELLVLSACKTASGDSRAALGLAGMAIRSGARSTLATLWSVSDESTSDAMETFYKVWVSGEVTKAEALRQAQLSLLNSSKFNLPYYWAPFVLLGNWL